MGYLGVIAMHYGERTPCDEICKEFVQQNPRRLFKPSLFLRNALRKYAPYRAHER